MAILQADQALQAHQAARAHLAHHQAAQAHHTALLQVEAEVQLQALPASSLEILMYGAAHLLQMVLTAQVS